MTRHATPILTLTGGAGLTSKTTCGERYSEPQTFLARYRPVWRINAISGHPAKQPAGQPYLHALFEGHADRWGILAPAHFV